MKLAVGIITLNSDFLLSQAIEAVYPFASQICVAEGPVQWWQDQGVKTSTDDTNFILDNFPDPDKKMFVTHGQYAEKTQQCRAWMQHIAPDTDYILCVDSDEVHTPENLEALIQFLEREKPTTVGFKSDSFYGGFDKIIGGFERGHSFLRVLKYEPGAVYKTHRQPTLEVRGKEIRGKDITGNQLYEATGITMWHGSYIAPNQVYDKIKYYEGAVIAKGQCIPNYFDDVFMQWCCWPEKRREIEEQWKGVQEFIPSARGESYTEPFTGRYPEIILRDMGKLMSKFNEQLDLWK